MLDQTYSITRHVCPRNCYSSCSMLGYTKNRRLIKVTGDPKHGYTKGLLCAKGYNYINNVYHLDRLKYPMRQYPRGSGQWQRISWTEAIDTIAGKVIELYHRYDSHLSLALNKYSGNMGVLHHAMEGFFNGLGRTSRAVGNPCWAPGMDAIYYDYGEHQTSDMEDILHAETIILWGINPVWTSIHAMNYIYEAQKRGAKVITIDPVYTETAKKSDTFIQIKPGSDGAIALAVAKYILEHNLYDAEFLTAHTNGWGELQEYIQPLSMEEALQQCGQTIEAIQFIAERLGRNKPAYIWLGFGMQRHQNGGQNIRAVNALAAITGNIGRKGSGVQFGQRTTWKFTYNILNHLPSDNQKAAGVRALDFNNFANDLQMQQDPPVKFLWITCRNLITQSANIQQLKKALQSMELIVTVEHFLTETAQYSDIVLPATTQFEEWDLVASYWHHWISINQPAIPPYFESKSELEIARMLSKRLNEFEADFSAFPSDFTDEEFIEQEFTDEFYQSLQIGDWRELLKGPRRVDVPKTAWEALEFKTPSGKIELFSQQASENQLSPFGMALLDNRKSENYPFTLLLNHEPFRINSQFQNLPSYKQINKEPSIYLHPSLAKEKGIRAGSLIRIFNENGEIMIRARYSEEVNHHTLVIHPNHPLINKLLAFTPADMGEFITGGKGNALNDLQVNIAKL
ncbi:molybdopterin-dependent oxidoreductase [Neobacillus vireti]|uniref:molybdopterin-dependent oxidoreductase n=1 Tax=Neobacillus vireti TaxID=220686 RepID=UPI00055480E1|nr:molybdopterin-dependent oxidoreductase [Neobacillus vireti]KLT15771.1 molybdopterin oxidoreductase [Neobacillus vireti]